MNLFKPNSIRHRFTFSLTAIITLVILSFSIGLVFYNSRSLEKDLNNQLDKLTAFSRESLSVALWQYNYDYVAEYIDSLFLYEDMVFASLRVKDKEIGEKVRPEFKESSFSFFKTSTKFISTETNITYKDVTVGVLQLVLSRDRIKHLIIFTSSLSILILLLVILAVFGTNFFISDRYLFKPLSRLERSVKEISSGKLDTAIDVDSKDEIGQLAQSFEQMMANLKRITASRDELNHEIMERKRAEKRLEGLNRLKESLLGSTPLNEKLKQITDGIVDILDADFARIWLTRKGDLCSMNCIHANISDGPNICRDRNRCLHLVASSGRYAQLDGTHGRVPFGCYKIGQIASAEIPGFLTNDIIHDLRIHNHDWAQKLNLVSFAGYRLLSGQGETMGVLALFSKQALSTKENTLLQTIASIASEVTQVSISQDMLRESEKKYRNLFENAQIGMFRSRVSDWKMVDSNHRMAQIFGYDSAEECIANYVANEHYLYPEKTKQVVDRLHKQGEVSNFEVQIRINDGSIKWIQFSGRLSENTEYFEGVVADITERKRAEDQVKASLKEKEVLFKEIHHRVKNNMQIIQSLLSLQSNEIKEVEFKKPLMDSNNRIKSMALIHEILYRSDNMALLDIKTYFNEIVQHLFKIYNEPGGDTTFSIDIEPIEMGMDLSIACGLIINELVSNALKYAFVSTVKGRLFISLKAIQTDEALLVIRDNGKGLPADLDLVTSNSLGLKIVKILVKGQLKGNMIAKNENGAMFEIRFPLTTG